jgi:hypothetical protein
MRQLIMQNLMTLGSGAVILRYVPAPAAER